MPTTRVLYSVGRFETTVIVSIGWFVLKRYEILLKQVFVTSFWKSPTVNLLIISGTVFSGSISIQAINACSASTFGLIEIFVLSC